MATKKAKAKTGDKRTAAEREADAKAVLAEIEAERVAAEASELGKDSIDIVRRNGEIFRAALRGLLPETLAPVYGLTPETVRVIIREARKGAPRTIDGEPGEILQEYVSFLEAAIDELAAVASKEAGTARVAAIRGRVEVYARKIEVLQQSGILPHDLGTMAIQIEVRTLAEKALAVLRAAGVEDEVLQRIVDVWDPQPTAAPLPESHQLTEAT